MNVKTFKRNLTIYRSLIKIDINNLISMKNLIKILTKII